MTTAIIAMGMLALMGWLMMRGYRHVAANPDNDPFVEEIRFRRAQEERYRAEDAHRGRAAEERPARRPAAPASRRGWFAKATPRRDVLIEPSPTLPGVPEGWTMREYVSDGLVRLQIMLIQHARKNP